MKRKIMASAVGAVLGVTSLAIAQPVEATPSECRVHVELHYAYSFCGAGRGDHRVWVRCRLGRYTSTGFGPRRKAGEVSTYWCPRNPDGAQRIVINAAVIAHP